MRIAALCLCLIACGDKREQPEPAPSAAPVAATAAFVDVTVIPMDREARLEHHTVLVDGERIVAVGPIDKVSVPPSATKIDGAGKFLIPGLIDSHVHFNDERDAILFVANGVTTVRNMWGNPETIRMKQRTRTEVAWPCPSIYTAGPIVDGDPPIWPGSSVVTTTARAAEEVAAQKAAGYDFVKVYEHLTPEVYEALRAAAASSGMRLAGHAPRRIPIETVLAGQASIEHLTGYSLAVGVKHEDIAKQTARAKIANCPTLVVLDRVARLDDMTTLLARPENKYVSAMTLASWEPKNDFRFKDSSPAGYEAMRALNVTRRGLVKALRDAGAPILAGTDTPNPFVVPGFSMHEELVLLVEAGLTPYESLRAATANAGEWIGERIGVVATGARADLLLLTADPLRDIASTTKRAGVMLRGHWHEQAALDAKLEALVAKPTSFDALPALPVPTDAKEVFRGTYTHTLGGRSIGRERLVVAKTSSGGHVIAAQMLADTSLAILIELDKQGHLVTQTYTGAKGTVIATLRSDQLTVDGIATTVTPSFLFDSEMIASIIPFARRATPGKLTTIRGRALPQNTDIEYTFDRSKPGPWVLGVTSVFGRASGTYEADPAGHPLRMSVTTPIGEFTAVRDP